MHINTIRSLLIFSFFLTGCSVKLSSVEKENILTVSRGDKTYWVRTKGKIPIYPYNALKKRIDGCVNVSYIVNASGGVESLKVIKSYPNKGFDKSALRAVKQYRYRSAEQNSRKISVRTNEIVTFLLDYPDYKSPSNEDMVRKCEVVEKLK